MSDNRRNYHLKYDYNKRKSFREREKSCSKSKRRRSREKYSRSKSKERTKDLHDYKYELRRYLDDVFNLRKLDDFWNFFMKYEAIQKLKKAEDASTDSRKLVNVRFEESDDELFEKLPVMDKNGERMVITRDQFGILLGAIRVYHDFQQKSRFSKLKQMRTAQQDLPIAKYKEEILQKVKENNVILIAGDTGCGKSTQVPQYILEAGYNKIACTQPRRIACVSLAKRVSHESLTTYKSTIGFQIRFEKTKNKRTNIVFLTEGILLRQASDGEVMDSYDVIILDEVHERHLNMDFLVGIMKCMLHKREFKLILMSATINLQLFEAYFGDEGVQTIKVPGRLFPIDIVYKPIVRDPYERKNTKFDCQPYLNVLEMIDAKYQPHDKGDLLVFLNGFNEISTLAAAVQQYSEAKRNWIVLQLHSSLALDEQDKVFYAPPEGVRKCIISTNIAETSVTIDGVRFVLDSGKVNRMTYENCGVNRLFETNISQDSAKQRAGRAGRTGPGICYRLYSEEQLKDFDAFTPAEIHLVPLETLILSMVTLGLSDIEAYPFLEKPSADSLKYSLERLLYLDALRHAEDGGALGLTTLGNAMSQLPVDLSISKMLILSTIFGTVNSVLALASLLSVQNPIMESRYYETQERRREHESNHGEPVTLLNLYKTWLEIKKDGSYGRRGGENSKTWARKRGVEEQRFYEVTKLIEQFRDILHEANLLPKIKDESLNSSERAIRYGELKALKTLRRDLKNDSRDVKQKKLKLQAANAADEEEEQGSSKDLRDVEFRISNDFNKLQQLLSETRTDSYKDLMLLKLVLSSALYPQIAMEDEFNSSKTVNDRLFHTKAKNYVFLRPTSFFCANPDYLQLDEPDIDVPPNGYFSKRPLSRRHQILVYQSLLETKKTYLVNTFRMPALQTLFLFGKKIATNSTLTRFVFDDFLTVDCPFLWQGKVMLLKVIALRKRIKLKLETKLNNLDALVNDEETYYFVQDLIDFMQSNISYNVRRLLPADLKIIYDHNLEMTFSGNTNPFDEERPLAKNASGELRVTENVIYNCLVPNAYDVDVENAFMAEIYRCPKCEEEILGLGFIEMLIHEGGCTKPIQERAAEANAEVQIEIKPNSKQFTCDKCQKQLTLTPVQFLKHKKTCVRIKTEH